MYEEMFFKRLTQLRLEKGLSARDMSLSLGQSESYINRIENQKMLPSMTVFFYICEFLGVTPKEFFDVDECPSIQILDIIDDLKSVDPQTLQHLAAIIKKLRD